MPCQFSPEAETDLNVIALRFAERNPIRALSFAEELHECCLKLAEHPGIGHPRPDLHPGLRSFARHKYISVYIESGAGIRIERIIHGARDIENVFEQG